VNSLSLLLTPLKLTIGDAVAAAPRAAATAGARGTRSVAEKVCSRRAPFGNAPLAPVPSRTVLGTSRATPVVPV
jgi:hypothetical protein